MDFEKKADQLLKGAIDLHCHSGPGLFKRALDHVEAARQAAAAGMAGVVLKDQHSLTAVLATIINTHVLGEDSPLKVYGGLVLNNASGGISAYTVEAAVKYGAKIIWLPTFSAQFHKDAHESMAASKIKNTSPKANTKMLPEVLLKVTDQFGNLLPQMTTIFELIAKADIILGLGHVSRDEMDKAIAEAKRCGVQKFVLNHPEHLHNLTIDEMKDYAAQGIMMEHSYTLTYSKKMTHEYLFEMIREVGAEYTILGSDMGQPGRPMPAEGFREFVVKMLELGLKDEEIRLVIRDNPRRMLGFANA